MFHHTKIVATLGPSSSDVKILTKMIEAGVNMVRLNFSHGTASDHIERARLVREIAKKVGRPVAILGDLQGPKIRIGKFENKKINLKKGAEFVLDAECELGNDKCVGLDYKNLPKDVFAGDMLLLDDGRIVLEVEKVVSSKIFTIVHHGGELSDNKGINRQGGGLSAPALTRKDMDDILTSAQMEVDYVAVSFPKSAADIYMTKQLIAAAGGKAEVIAKIERAEAILVLDEIIEASDGIMVARGDLAVEVGNAAVPALQKRMIRMAREKNRLTITATQMMESMITSPIPTRAEVSDVANAVLDGTDAVMLSAETASGEYPVETVETMVKICLEAEKSSNATLDNALFSQDFKYIDQSIAMATIWTAHHLKVKAIVTLTETGQTALLMSRLSCGVPIYALTPIAQTEAKMSLYRTVYPILMSTIHTEQDKLTCEAERLLVESGMIKDGDLIVITVGEKSAMAGGTNTMKIVRVGKNKCK